MNSKNPSGTQNRIKRWILPLSTLLAALIFVALLFLYRLRSARRQEPGLQPFSAPDWLSIQGLGDEEAAARLNPEIKEEEKKASKRVRQAIWRTSTFSIFNFSILGLAIVQIILNDALNALGSLLVLFLSIVLTAVQQLYATGQVEKLMHLALPRATVIRGGQIKSINVDQVVVDDVLVVGPGDQFPVDGQLITEMPLRIRSLDGDSEAVDVARNLGDSVRAGAYCIEGRAAYRATSDKSTGREAVWNPASPGKDELTPLQMIMDRLLRLLLIIIAIFLIILFVDMANVPFMTDEFEAIFREAASIIFSIAPSGIFFMIVVTYALGSARIGSTGALVRDTRAVEALAQVTTLCFSKTGVLTGAQVQIEPTPGPDGQPILAESRIHQLLGEISQTIKSDNLFMQALADNYAGIPRSFSEAAPYLSVYGWSGISFIETDLRGTYIIGEPGIVASYLEISDQPDSLEGSDQDGTAWKFRRLTRLFQREQPENQLNSSAEEANPPEGEINYQDQARESRSGVLEDPADRSIYSRLRSRTEQIVNRTFTGETQEEVREAEFDSGPQLILAYSPKISSLFDDLGRPSMPEKLQSLGTLRFDERIRPEASEAIQTFIDSGVDIKILSSDEGELVAHAAEQLGLLDRSTTEEDILNGWQIRQMEEADFASAVGTVKVFANLSGEQKGSIVQQLRKNGERVGMVADGVDDLEAIREANLNITLQSSSQTALSMADIVLLKDSLHVLPATLQQGQRIVNGLLDILKINIAQVSTVLVLLIAMFIEGRRVFYYHPTHGGVIAFFTVIGPSLGLTIWASSGALPRKYMRSRLWHFIVPAAATMALGALLISKVIFRYTTDIVETELAVTYGLILMGLLLVVFVQPPIRAFVGGDVLSGDWRPSYMAIGLFVVYNLLVFIPLAQNLLRVAPLSFLWEIALIGLVSLLWAILIRTIWRSRWMTRYVGILTSRLEEE